MCLNRGMFAVQFMAERRYFSIIIKELRMGFNICGCHQTSPLWTVVRNPEMLVLTLDFCVKCKQRCCSCLQNPCGNGEQIPSFLLEERGFHFPFSHCRTQQQGTADVFCRRSAQWKEMISLFLSGEGKRELSFLLWVSYAATLCYCLFNRFIWLLDHIKSDPSSCF